MIRYIIRRIFYMALTLFIVATISFFLMHMLPGSPLKSEEKLSESQAEIVKEKYGLNEPAPVQYVKYLGGLLKGDLGISFDFNDVPVSKLLIDRLGPSLTLGAQALIFGTIGGIILGLISAIFKNGPLDYTSTIIAVLGTSIPSFIFAGLLQWFVAVKWDLLPIALWGDYKHTVLPTIALAIFPMATAARFTRTEMLEVLSSDFIVTARAKGLKESRVIFKHGMRNALIPIVTVMGPMAVSLMTGTLVIEQIFAVPGIGALFVESIIIKDLNVIMGTTMMFAFLFVSIILIIDILYVIIDPRIRLTGGEK